MTSTNNSHGKRRAARKTDLLTDFLDRGAERQPKRCLFTFLKDGETPEDRWDYATLRRKALLFAEHLNSTGGKQGDRALLVFPPGLDYIAAFFGCLYAGIIAVPIYPPHPARMDRDLERLLKIVKNALPSFALTTADAAPKYADICRNSDALKSIRWLAAPPPTEGASLRELPRPDVDAIAFLQYTSGSTGDPKGVMVSHANLSANTRMIHDRFGAGSDDTAVSWLPLYHDMGLIGMALQCVMSDVPCYIMSPVAFLQRPVRWLQTVSKHRATITGGPNFAYDLCVRRITEAEKATLDLSRWQIAFSGAEPIRKSTMDRFSEAFSRCGFNPEALYPCYGLAEGTLMIAGSQRMKGFTAETFSAEMLKEHRAAGVPETDSDARWLVASGLPADGLSLRIIDPESRVALPENRIGEIWINGPNVTGGYWHRPTETEDTFAAALADDDDETRWLRTGDLGFLKDGRLFVTGRLKDLIIIRGRNHYPQDIERTVESSYPSLRPGCCTAFAVEKEDEERLVVVAEMERRHRKGSRRTLQALNERRETEPLPVHVPDTDTGPDMRAAVDAIRQAVSKAHHVQLYAVVFIKVAHIPKTSSGKVRRNTCREMFLNGTLPTVGGSLSSPVETEARVRAPDRPVWESANTEGKRGMLTAYLKELTAAVLKRNVADLPEDRPLTALGLDSLMAVEIQHRVETDFGLSVPMTELLGDATLTDICTLALANPLLPSTEIPSRPPSDHAPLSHNQRSLWFLHRLAPESTAYHVSFAVKILSPLNATALKRAFEWLVERHPTLRTVYSEESGEPMQRVLSEAFFGWSEIDAADLADDSLEALLAEAAARPFDPATGPMLRVDLFRTAKETFLLFSVHHIAVDLWSLSVMMDELGLFYADAVGGGPPSPPALSRTYFDYVARQHRTLDGGHGKALEEYWRRRLGDDLPVLDLPADFPRPPVQTFNGSAVAFRISPERFQQVKALAAAHRTTPYVVLMTTFQILLGRYTGLTDIPVGSPATGRTAPAFQGVVGYFANPVVIRTTFPDDPTFSELLPRVRQTVLEALEHQDFPFSLLVERLRPERDAARPPLFQVMFVLEKPHRVPAAAPFVIGATDARMSLGDLELASVPLARGAAQFDMTLMMVEHDGACLGSLEYNTDLFLPATARRFADHYQTLLGSILTSPDQAISRLGFLTTAERESLISGVASGFTPISRERSVVAMIEDRAASEPNWTAVADGDRRLTFGDVNLAANRLAHFLRERHGIVPDDPVCVLLDRSEWSVICMLAILKAGGVYVPIDPAHPIERIRYILEDSGCRVLLTEPARPESLTSFFDPERVVDVRGATHEESENPAPVCSPENLSYMIYTSGSTGRPKGVMQTHRCIDNLIAWQIEQTGTHRHILQYAAIGFDVSVQETLYALASGSTLYVIPQTLRYDMAGLADFIETRGIDMFTMPFSALNLLFQEPAFGDGAVQVEDIVTSGEALHVTPEIRRFLEARPGVRLHNQYGPTETHVITSMTLSAEQGNITEYPPIGRPVSNTRILILDDRNEPTPVGLVGEICAGGDNVARGYLHREALTAEKFIPDPFDPGDRLYRTGDLGRRLADGTIEYLGRNDDQVKIRGHRVEPGEIQTHLMQHPSVREATVLAGKIRDSMELVAYWVAKDAREETPAFEAFLGDRLPAYMRPAFFIRVDQFSYTPNGKIDRRALPEPDASHRPNATAYAPPRDRVETVLTEIWREVLDLEIAGIHDNFFECGGHSLKATQLAGRIRSRLKVTLPLKALFQHPTVATLAEVVRGLAPEQFDPIQPAEVDDTPLTDTERETLLKLLEQEGNRE